MAQPPLFLKAELTIVPGHVDAMLGLLKDRIFPIMEGAGWRMMGCFVQRTGRLNTIVDIWQLEGYAAFATTYEAFRAHPEYGEIRELLSTYVETETLIFMEAHGGRLSQSEK